MTARGYSMPPLSQARRRFHPPGAGKLARNPRQIRRAQIVDTDSGNSLTEEKIKIWSLQFLNKSQ
jgi:hypothetical protein